MDAYRKVLAIDPGSTMWWNNLGTNLANCNDQKGAMAATAKRSRSTHGSAWPGGTSPTAWPARRTTRPPGAAYCQATAVEPRNPLSWVRLGDFLHEQNDGKAAADAYAKALAITPRDASTWGKRGRRWRL